MVTTILAMIGGAVCLVVLWTALVFAAIVLQTARHYLALRDALAVIDWMSGSKDFSPGGQAYAGWLAYQSTIRKIEKLVRP